MICDWADRLDEPIQWNVLMSVIFFEDPAKGFPEPRLRLFQVGPCAREDGSRGLPFVFHTVVPGSQDRFLLENLPEPFKVCVVSCVVCVVCVVCRVCRVCRVSCVSCVSCVASLTRHASRD